MTKTHTQTSTEKKDRGHGLYWILGKTKEGELKKVDSVRGSDKAREVAEALAKQQDHPDSFPEYVVTRVVYRVEGTFIPPTPARIDVKSLPLEE